MNNNPGNINSLDSYSRTIKDQKLKGTVLKLKNEIRKPEALWYTVKELLETIENMDKSVFQNIIYLLLK